MGVFGELYPIQVHVRIYYGHRPTFMHGSLKKSNRCQFTSNPSSPRPVTALKSWTLYSSTRQVLFLLTVIFIRRVTASAIHVPFNSAHRLGPDGPWQAIDIYLDNQDITVYPDISVSGESSLQLKASCYPYDNSSITCGLGGFWSGISKTDNFEFRDGLNTTDGGFQLTDRNVSVTGSQSMSNVTVIILSHASDTLPNGTVVGWPLGTINMGYTSGVTNTEGGYSVLSRMFEQGLIPSYSYGLHIGSAALDYVGSLYFGGYDKGRTIGPYTSFTETLSLLDVELNVAIGSLPLGLSPKPNILSTLDGNSNRPVRFLSNKPYLYLPQRLCAAIADNLPVYFDHSMQYWLWNTSDPMFTALLGSPAYLGFTFPPGPGNNENVTIKVPLTLFNLTLTNPYSTNNASYFPCVSYSESSSILYGYLGRAFLQAAFIGHSFNTGIYWLAQAPGPGVNGQGLGEVPTDILNNDNSTIDMFTDDDNMLFVQSWQGYWKINNTQNNTSPHNNTSLQNNTNSQANNTSGLSEGAKAGIGVGASVGGLALLGLVSWLLYRYYYQTTAQDEIGSRGDLDFSIGTSMMEN
ncbi:hypothetical protein V8E54_011302 [Elaphomyces granulatus]